MANPATTSDFKIATYASGTGGLVTLRSLKVSNPRPIYQSGVSVVRLGDNSARLMGSPVLTWQWGFISQAERDILRAYCTGASARVYITSPTIDKVSGVSNAAKTYDAQMIWPDPTTPEAPQAGRRLEFVLLFRGLAVVP
jgi:hypothetical protein